MLTGPKGTCHRTPSYDVPHLFDRLLTGDDGKRWYAANDVIFLQSDWFFAWLLHEYRPDPLHVFGVGQGAR